MTLKPSNIPANLSKWNIVSLPDGKGKARILQIINTGEQGKTSWVKTNKWSYPLAWLTHIKDSHGKESRKETVWDERTKALTEVYTGSLGLPLYLWPQTAPILGPAADARARIRHLIPGIFQDSKVA